MSHVTHVGNTKGFALYFAITVIEGKAGFTEILFQRGKVNSATVRKVSLRTGQILI